MERMEAAPLRMPTGIGSFDPVMEGGVPPGSVMLLLGDIGAGSFEFVYTSNHQSRDAQAAGSGESAPAVRDPVHHVHEDEGRRPARGRALLRQEPGLGARVRVRPVPRPLRAVLRDLVRAEGWYTADDLMTRLKRRRSMHQRSPTLVRARDRPRAVAHRPRLPDRTRGLVTRTRPTGRSSPRTSAGSSGSRNGGTRRSTCC